MSETITLSWKEYQALQDRATRYADIYGEKVTERVREVTRELNEWNAELRQANQMLRDRLSQYEK